MSGTAKKIAGYLGIGALLIVIVFMGNMSGKAGKKTTTGNNIAVTAVPLHLQGGWGYKIEVNHRLYIYQNQIPCLPGKQLFHSKATAMAAADIVVQKIIHGEPPAISKDELEKILPPNDY
jgi:hypothetical protein